MQRVSSCTLCRKMCVPLLDTDHAVPSLSFLHRAVALNLVGSMPVTKLSCSFSPGLVDLRLGRVVQGIRSVQHASAHQQVDLPDLVSDRGGSFRTFATVSGPNCKAFCKFCSVGERRKTIEIFALRDKSYRHRDDSGDDGAGQPRDGDVICGFYSGQNGKRVIARIRTLSKTTLLHTEGTFFENFECENSN